jgi:tRNA A-37 threonylcarbamoyl transferase component Bud32
MESIGRYQIVKELGHGAMGVVYQAVDPTIGRQVAIKTIRLDDVDDAEERAKLRERLFREARSAGILSHPGIVTIYDMEERGDIAFIAMEFVDGPTLDQLLSSKQPIAPERLINILRQTAAALDYAHAKGIVHRDIKPANIMMASDGAVKITDFGIAKVTTSQQYTQTGTILGTPNYMSPEQVQGLAVTGRADQFSLAVIAFEMLTGERPFTGEHLTTVVYKIVAEDPPPVQRLNPTLSPQIDAVLRRALLKKPEGRYNLCIEFLNGLDAACANTQGWKNLPRGGSMNLPTVATEAIAVPTVAGSGTTTEEAFVGRRRRSKWVLPFAAAVIVAVGLIGLIALQFGPGLGIGHTTTDQPPTPAASNPPANVTPASNPPVTTPVEDKKPSAMDTPPVPAPVKPEPGPTQTATAKTSDEKNQLPAESDDKPEAAPPVEQRPKVKARPANGPQDVLVTSEPPGATAVLDNNPAVSCKTPCMLSVLPGRHAITVNQDGYQRESREIRIIDSPLELPTVTLRTQSGTLMLTSTPSGAAIFVNDKQYPQTTPAQVSLPPGTYNVRVEKNGLQKSKAIEIQNGVTNFINIPLQP